MTAGILVLNAGSSSLKFAVYRVTGGTDVDDLALHGQVSGIGTAPVFSAALGANASRTRDVGAIGDHRQAIATALDWIAEHSADMRLVAVGHRVVHGGAERRDPALVDDRLLAELDALSPLAPHHQPHNLAAIRAVRQTAPELPQVVCFDTAFHASQSAVARTLPLPRTLRERGIQRYGFHGLSYEYITAVVPDHNAGRMPERLLVAHLGNGASLCAIEQGVSVATSMGFSTLDGLMMGTRCGSIDPGVLLHLMREARMDEPALSRLLYNDSGLLGVSGISADMQVLLDSSDPRAAEAIELYCYTLVRGIGSMVAAMGGIDALVFTGGIGEHAGPIRERVCRQLTWLGIDLDRRANVADRARISSADSAVGLFVIATREELVIARHTLRLVDAGAATA